MSVAFSCRCLKSCSTLFDETKYEIVRAKLLEPPLLGGMLVRYVLRSFSRESSNLSCSSFSGSVHFHRDQVRLVANFAAKTNGVVIGKIGANAKLHVNNSIGINVDRYQRTVKYEQWSTSFLGFSA